MSLKQKRLNQVGFVINDTKEIESIKLGLKYTPSAPPDVVASITTISQVSMSAPALQFATIPVIPAGAAASFAIPWLNLSTK